MLGLNQFIIFCTSVGIVFSALGLYFSGRARTAIARLFVLVLISSGLSFLFFALMRLPGGSVDFLNWAGKVEYVILSFVLPNLWFATICLVSATANDARRKFAVASLTYMFFGALIAVTNPFHDLFWNESLLSTELIHPQNGTMSLPQKYFRHFSGIFVLGAAIVAWTAKSELVGSQGRLVKWCRRICLLPLGGFILAQATVFAYPAWTLNSAFVYVITFGVSSWLIIQKMLQGNILSLAKAAQGLIVDQMQSAVLVMDENGLVIYRNTAARDLFGQDYGAGIADLKDILDRNLGEGYAVIKSSEQKNWDTDENYHIGQRFFEFTEKPFTDKAGERIGTVVKIENRTQDVLDRKRIQELVVEAEAANQSKSAFLANMSHEIRTPMNGVLAMTELLVETSLDKVQQDSLGVIKESGESLLTIINDILDFSKIESGSFKIEQAAFDLRKCIEDVTDLLVSKTPDKVHLLCDIDPRLAVSYIGDITRLRQVLINLIGNAIKFTTHGEVLVSVTVTEISDQRHGLNVSIKDTGVGIPEDRMDKLFKSFSQVDESTTRKYGGTGLGLVISKRIVELMGGAIRVESQLGVGSCFGFDLSFDIAENVVESDVSLHFPDDARVLVVEGHATNRSILQKRLEHWGLSTLSVESGESALRTLQSDHDFGVGIVDMQLPDINGVDLADKIREQIGENAFPLILLSTKDLSTVVQESEFIARLNKPVRIKSLFDSVALGFGLISREQSLEVLPVCKAMSLAERMPLTILVAEDNGINQIVAGKMLMSLGYDIDLANDGREALELVHKNDYDIVFMDIFMPNMDGCEATIAIREKLPPHKQPIIVALTANAMVGDREAYLDIGMDDYLSKPFSALGLQTLILRQANNPKLIAAKRNLERELKVAPIENVI